MAKSPLDHPRLRAIERKLDAGQIEEAQHLLSQLGQDEFFRHATTYLVIRVRYLRGQLDLDAVISRLETLIVQAGSFPEAKALLDQAKTGTLTTDRPEPRQSAPPPEVELAFSTRESAPPPFPRAGRVPNLPMERRSPSSPDEDTPIPDLNLGTRPPPGFPPEGVRPQTDSPRAPASSAPSAARTTAPHIVSAAPPAVETPAFSLFEIAELLDEGRLTEALTALEALGRRDEPDHALMEARVLSRSGRRAAALELVERLAQAPLLEPEIRAGVARLAIELDQIELAFEQAKTAATDDASQPMVRLSLAWAALRKVRRNADPELVATARSALGELHASGPYAALALALSACLEAHAGSSERARILAERSLAIEPSVDGLAALTMACLRLGQGSEAGRAGVRLRQLSASEASALETAVDDFGEKLFELGFGDEGGFEKTVLGAKDAEEIWGPLELALVEGRRDEAWSIFAQLADDTLAQVSRTARQEPPALAAVAANFLTVAPITRDFAPFDSTLPSLDRIDAALELIAARPRTDRSETRALLVLVGAYVGEVLRQSLGLRWHGSPAVDEQVAVESSLGRWHPIEIVSTRLVEYRKLHAERALELARRRSSAFAPHLPPAAPPCPWDPAPWPQIADLPSFARAIARSVVSVYVGEHGGSLDGSPRSVRALDGYLDLLAPRGISLANPSGWARRTATLTGAYFGEILRESVGGQWASADELELRPDSYLLQTTRGTLMPIAYVWARLSGNAPSLAERLERILGHEI